MSLDLLQNIRRHGFKRLLLAVSGGLDSICLAHYFICNKEALGIEWLGIAHVHHGLREGTADRDAAFVEAFAKAHNVPFFFKKLDGEALKNAEGSLEENARDARYKALLEITQDPAPSNLTQLSQQVDKFRISTTNLRFSAQDDTFHISHSSLVIVTAHHAGDQAETMYMRLRRGTTLAGLRGIQEIRKIKKDTLKSSSNDVRSEGGQHLVTCNLSAHGPQMGRIQGVHQWIPSVLQTSRMTKAAQIFRPFLSVSREDLLAYARENNLTWCEDESNSDVKFARNKVRHVYLPQLAREYCDAATQLCRIASLADKAYAKVMDKCNELFNSAVQQGEEIPACAGMTLAVHSSSMHSHVTHPSSLISLNKKALRKILLSHADADLSEMFRLWLSELGFRFPIGFFYDQKEPAHVKIPVRAAYRKRSIVKKGSTVLICEFEDVQTASKFVSCGMKE